MPIPHADSFKTPPEEKAAQEEEFSRAIKECLVIAEKDVEDLIQKATSKEWSSTFYHPLNSTQKYANKAISPSFFEQLIHPDRNFKNRIGLALSLVLPIEKAIKYKLFLLGYTVTQAYDNYGRQRHGIWKISWIE